MAVAVLNQFPSTQRSVIMLEDVGFNASLPAAGSVKVRSTWGEQGKLLDDGKGYVVEVQGQGAALLVFEKISMFHSHRRH